MANRPLTTAEIAYLKRLKASLDASWQALMITLGLLALPVAFLGLGAASSHAGDRLAMALAGAILIALIGAVVYYSARGRTSRKLDLGDAARFKGLLIDLAHPEAARETARLSGKEIRRKGKTAEGEARKEYWLLAGDRRYQVSPEHYMEFAAGDVLELELARESKVVLTINGAPDRIPVSMFGKERLEIGPADR